MKKLLLINILLIIFISVNCQFFKKVGSGDVDLSSYPTRTELGDTAMALRAYTNTINVETTSRTIYVDDTLGNDTTGTGLISAGFRTGSFKIINDGTSTYMSPDEFITNSDPDVSSTSIVFSSDVSGSSIRINATLNSTGDNAEMRYDIKRVMRTPLTF